MSSDQARRILVVMWLGAVGLQVANQVITASQSKNASSQSTLAYLVPPHKLLATSIVFSALFGLAEWTPQLALALASAVDLMVLLGPVVVGSGSNGTLFDKLGTLVTAEA